jgi:hypothetical protein
MPYRVSVVCLWVLLSVTLGCKKDKMPKPTRDGTNKIACKVNGDVVIFSGKCSFMTPLCVSLDIRGFPAPDTTKGISLHANGEDNLSFNFYLDIEDPVIGKLYEMTYHYPYENSFCNLAKVKYYVDTALSSVTFSRFDDKVRAGYFQFVGISKEGNMVQITEGWFDIPRE